MGFCGGEGSWVVDCQFVGVVERSAGVVVSALF